jgi:hypothetical protein
MGLGRAGGGGERGFGRALQRYGLDVGLVKCDEAAVHSHGDGGQVEVVEEDRQVVMKALRRREVELQRPGTTNGGGKDLPHRRSYATYNGRTHVPGGDAGHVAGLGELAEPELDAEVEVGASERLLDLVAVDEDVSPEEDGGAEGDLLVAVLDLEAFARARCLQQVCNNGNGNG